MESFKKNTKIQKLMFHSAGTKKSSRVRWTIAPIANVFASNGVVISTLFLTAVIGVRIPAMAVEFDIAGLRQSPGCT